jgi:hypothetical protein
VAIDAHLRRARRARRGKKNPRRRAERRSDLALAVRCGWRVEWVRDLDPDDYAELVDLLTPTTPPDDPAEDD